MADLKELDKSKRESLSVRVESKRYIGADFVEESERPGTPSYNAKKAKLPISHRKAINVTLTKLLENGFRYREGLTYTYVDKAGNYVTRDLVPGYLGSSKKLCKMYIPLPKVLDPAHLLLKADVENAEVLAMIDHHCFSNASSSLTSHDLTSCQSQVQIKRYSNRSKIEVRKFDVFVLSNTVQIQVLEVELHKAKSNSKASDYFEPRWSRKEEVEDTSSSNTEFAKVRTFSEAGGGDSPNTFKRKKIKSVGFKSEVQALNFTDKSEVTSIETVTDADEVLSNHERISTPKRVKWNVDIKTLSLKVSSLSDKSNTTTVTLTKNRIVIGSSRDADVVIAGIKPYHAMLEIREGELYFFDLSEEHMGCTMLLTRFIEVVVFDVLSLGGLELHLHQADRPGWKNCACVISKVRDSNRKDIIAPDMDLYPKLVMTLGLQRFFSSQFVIGSSPRALISIKDMQITANHALISLDS